MSQLPLNPPRLEPDARTYLTAVWLDWRNNYLGAEKFAEHNSITPAEARLLLAVARSVFDSPHPEA